MKLTSVVLALMTCMQQGGALPLTISASSAGGWGDDWWFVDVKPSGRTEVTPSGPAKELVLDSKTMDELRSLVREEGFFDLGDKYGAFCVDCSFCTLTVQLGKKSKRIALGYLDDPSDQEKGDAAKVLRVFNKVKAVVGIADREDACRPRPRP
jgi:hypothetical protein